MSNKPELTDREIRSYFEAIYEKTKGLIEVRTIHPETEKAYQSFFGETPDAVSYCLKHRESHNVYIGVATRRENGKGTKDNLAQVSALWADVDFASFPGGEEEARQVLETFPLPPSMIVHSGGGLHTYWLLEEPEEADDLQRIEGCLRGLAEALKADAVWDLSRILRPPDTFNHPNAQKRKARREKAPVRLESLDGSRYNLSDFDQWWQEPPFAANSVNLEAIPQELPERFLDLLETNERVKATLERQRPDLKDQSRSGLCMAMAHLLVKEGFTDEEIASVILKMRPESASSSITTTIGKARRAYEEVQRPTSTGAIQLVAEDLNEFITREIERPEPLIEAGILPVESVAVVGGISKLGKSVFVMNMGLSLASDQPFLGLFPVPQPRRVLYVQQEISEASMQERARKMIEHLGRPLPEGNFLLINFKGLRLDEGRGFDALSKALDLHQPEVVILDPLYKFHSGDENKVQDMAKFFNKIDQAREKCGTAFVITHHHGKPSQVRKEGGQLLRGSSTIFDYGDSYLILERYGAKKDRRAKLTFELRNDDDPDPLILHLNPETLWFEVGDGDRRKVTEQDVVGALKKFIGHTEQKPLIEAICGRTGAGDTTARKAIYEARDKSLVIEHPGRPVRYSLPD
jgi:hypothetical protein